MIDLIKSIFGVPKKNGIYIIVISLALQLCLIDRDFKLNLDKFLFSNDNSYDIIKICIQYKVAEHCPIFLSPVFGRIEPKEIVEYMIEHHWNEARLQLQMHKFIWPPEQRGV